MIATSELCRVFTQHHDSLPMTTAHSGFARHWPWMSLFIGFPAAGVLALEVVAASGLTTSVGLLAGISVLGGLLFQVLAWVSNRIANIADGMDGRKPSAYELALVARLDIARANIAYSSLVSIVFVAALGMASMLVKEPSWFRMLNAFLLLHLSCTLVLVLLRINSIGQDDRIAALTAHARARSHQ